MEPVLRGSPPRESLICTSWPQLTAIHPSGLTVCGLPLNVTRQPGTGGRGAGKRTWTPLLARCPSIGESSRNCSFSEKSPYGWSANHSTPRLGSPGSTLTVPSRCNVACEPPA
jgi:hypothetical protein